MTAHDAFRYFGRAYGIEVRGIQGISTESEAGLNEINALVDFLVQRRIRAVFVESSVSTRNLQAIREGCQARGHRLALGGELFSDAMGADDSPEGTYEGMVRHNVRTIVEALQ
ncbi:MAG: zinc ABC transporter substrate-binding protein [Gemmataceae bacterium]